MFLRQKHVVNSLMKLAPGFTFYIYLEKRLKTLETPDVRYVMRGYERYCPTEPVKISVWALICLSYTHYRFVSRCNQCTLAYLEKHGQFSLKYNAFNVYRRELAPGTVSLTGDRAQGDDNKHWAYSSLPVLSVKFMKMRFLFFGIQQHPKVRVY